MKNIFLTLLVVVLASPLAFASWSCNGHVAYGVPGQSDQLLCRSGYAAGYNYTKKVADWVAYRVNYESVTGGVGRQKKFKADLEIPSAYRSTLSDYKGSGFDRGHLAPSATMDFDITSAKESYLLTNMAPQLPGLNRQGWRYLEAYVRDWTEGRDNLFIVTGTLYEEESGWIGNHVKIPSHFYKVIFDEKNNDAIAFIIPHRKTSKGEIPSFIVSVDEVEERSGLDFFSVLPDDLEQDIEDDIEQLW